MIPISSLLNPEPPPPAPSQPNQPTNPLGLSPQDYFFKALEHLQINSFYIASQLALIGLLDPNSEPNIRMGLCLQAAIAFLRINQPRRSLFYAKAGLALNPNPDVARCFHWHIAQGALAIGNREVAFRAALATRQLTSPYDYKALTLLDNFIRQTQPYNIIPVQTVVHRGNA